MSASLLPCRRLTTAVMLLASHIAAQSLFADDIAIAPVAEKQNARVALNAAQFQSFLQLPMKSRMTPKESLQNQLKVKVLTLDAKCSLTAEQRDKLQLAGRGDIIRTMSSLAQLQAQYVDKVLAAEDMAALRSEIHRRVTIPLRYPFTKDSLFHKVLTKSLSADQFARFDEWNQARRRLEIRTALTSFVNSSAMQTAAGTPDITELVMKRYPRWRPIEPYSQLVVMVMVNELQDEIRPLVNDAQWESVKKTPHQPTVQNRSCERWGFGRSRIATIDTRPTVELYTIGHSTHPPERFLELLAARNIELLADIRRFPGSRKFPHFNRENLETLLANAGIGYRWFEELGGRRKGTGLGESPNGGLRNESFRNYADHMLTDTFHHAIEELRQAARGKRTAYMCSESVFWRCHRRLVSDYLLAQGDTVWHIMPNGERQPHTLTAGAVITDGNVTYPGAADPQMTLFD